MKGHLTAYRVAVRLVTTRVLLVVLSVAISV